MRKLLLLLVAAMFCYGLAYAGELVAKESVNYLNEGIKAQKARKFDLAEINYRKTLLLDPYNTKWQVIIMNNRGAMLAQMGDMDRAEAQLDAALRIDPNYAPAKLNLGLIYEKHRSELESIKYWLKTLNIDLDRMKPKSYLLGEFKESEPVSVDDESKEVKW